MSTIELKSGTTNALHNSTNTKKDDEDANDPDDTSVEDSGSESESEEDGTESDGDEPGDLEDIRSLFSSGGMFAPRFKFPEKMSHKETKNYKPVFAEEILTLKQAIGDGAAVNEFTSIVALFESTIVNELLGREKDSSSLVVAQKIVTNMIPDFILNRLGLYPEPLTLSEKLTENSLSYIFSLKSMLVSTCVQQCSSLIIVTVIYYCCCYYYYCHYDTLYYIRI